MTPETPKGDKLCHTTPPDPSSDPSSFGARARDADPAGGEKADFDPKAREKWFKRFAPTWPTWLDSSEAKARKAAEALSEAECLEAEAQAPAYLAAVKATPGRNYVCSLQVYFAEKRWQRLPERAPAAAGPVRLAPFGKGWMAWRLHLLAAGPTGEFRPNAFQQRMIDDGKGELLGRDRQRALYPAVAVLDDAAEQGRGATVAPGEAPQCDGYERIRRGSVEWHRWAAWHAERGWPWIDPPAHIEWIYVPTAMPPSLVDSVAGSADRALTVEEELALEERR